ncbi:caspase, EACC1-associated type [Streptomyces wuyuanensis]|uniref:caspase, EACC1-associated type n=1 Tax=Streptomyces wuyuanensis TaxID=1196353 RepID=UPI0036B8E31B
MVGIGTYTHPDLVPLPAAATGVAQLAALLRDPTVWGLPPDHVTVLGTGASAEQILSAVRDAAKQVTDTLLVYFAGHGLRDRDERLYLALAHADADHPQVGTLLYRTLRDVLRQSGHRARYRLTVLDCCYSGLAGAMSATTIPTRADLAHVLEEPTAELGEDTDDHGDVVLTSAPPTRRSFVPPGAALPEFTGELISVLQHGITGAGTALSVEDAWRRIRRRLRDRGSPEPQQFAQNTVARQVRFHNRAGIDTPPTVTRRPWRKACASWHLLLMVKDGTVYVGEGDVGNAGFVALDAASGSRLWTTSIGRGGAIEAGEGMAYVSSSVSVCALDAATGAERWTHRMPFCSRPELACKNGAIYINRDGVVEALDTATGRERWTRATGIQPFGPMAVGDGALYAPVDGGVLVMDTETGTRLRTLNLPPSVTRPHTALWGRTIYLGHHQRVYALEASTGIERWTYHTDNGAYVMLPTVSSEAIYLNLRSGGDRNRIATLVALDAATGRERWAHQLDNRIFHGIAVADGIVYGSASTGYVYAWDAATGTQRWASYLGDWNLSPPVVADGLVYIRSEKHVHALDAATGERPEYGRN